MIAEAINSSFTTSKLDELRCFICKGYLSCSPIRVLPNGNCICGRCSPSNCDTPIYRVLQLETILSEVLFPCQFIKDGCTRRLLFGFTAEHESTCKYRKFACPSLKSCPWKGYSSQLHDHFQQKHSDLIKKDFEFNFKMAQDARGFFTLIQEDLFFVLKYLYSQSEKSLKYDIRCSVKTEYDIFYNLHLISGSDGECSLNLKFNKCRAFDDSFYEMQKTYDVNKCFEALGSPSSVTVVINLKPSKASCANTQQEAAKPNPVVNYDLLESIRCIRCQYYLIAPLYGVLDGTICYGCRQFYSSASPIITDQLQDLLDRLNYPCQWNDCNFVGNSVEIKSHRLSCKFRTYKCIVKGCNAIFKQSSVDKHVKNNHLDDIYAFNCAYKIPYSRSPLSKCAFVIRDNVLLTIQHLVSEHYLRIRLLSDFTLTILIQFQHEHCKIKSKIFTLPSNSAIIIVLQSLPPCFKNDNELTIIICDVQ